jgi:lysophospholipase L1-like esterase
LSDSVHFFDRIVAPVRPSIIVMYAGDNDIAGGKSPETIQRDFTSFVDKVHKELPDCRKVVYVAIKPSVKRWALADKAQDANRRIRETCEQDAGRLQFLDIWTPMLDAKGMPRPDLLVEDGLHMNTAGYQIWNDALRSHLTEAAIPAAAAR